MKKTIEYLKELFEEPLELVEDSFEKDFYLIIKAAQEDTIRETVKECINVAKIEYYEFKEDWMEEPDNITRDDYGNIHGINPQSILSVADRLIKEL